MAPRGNKKNVHPPTKYGLESSKLLNNNIKIVFKL